MDVRGTLSPNESFAEKLTNYHLNKEKVSMIVDDGGLQRAEGVIKSIHFDSDPLFFELEDGQRIHLRTVIAINGTFLSDYAEC